MLLDDLSPSLAELLDAGAASENLLVCQWKEIPPIQCGSLTASLFSSLSAWCTINISYPIYLSIECT